jgi:outer membrane lipopolysaccharide assembly protein LptE/RlpB
MKKFISILFVTLLSACSSNFQSATQVDDIAYLQISGDFTDAELIINGNQAVSLNDADTFKLNGQKVAKFNLTLGNNVIEIKRNQKTLVKRKLYVTQGNTVEVRVP